MKLETKDENYAATVVRVANQQKLSGLDNLVGLPAFGYQALIPKTTINDELGLLFTAETQLSEELCSFNNLYRHKEKNSNPEVAGYLEDTRRVKAIKFRGNISSALWLPLSCLGYLGIDITKLRVGDSFTHIDGNEVCKKYRVARTGAGKVGGRADKTTRVLERLFPKHFDTSNWFKNSHVIAPDEMVFVTQKLHGTSARFANQLVARKLNWKERIAKWLGVKVIEHEYAYLAGTRNTIRDPGAEAFFTHDIWTEWLEKIKHTIPKNWVIYGEIIGYAGNKPIQANYDYRHGPDQSSLYVYRIAVVNSDGIAVDLGWDVVRHWCKSVGLQAVPELTRGFHHNVSLFVQDYMNETYSKAHDSAVALGSDSPCDEGVCIRTDRTTPVVLKAKSPVFLEMETRNIDSGAEDLEEAQQV